MRADREDSYLLVSSRHLMVRHALACNPSAGLRSYWARRNAPSSAEGPAVHPACGKIPPHKTNKTPPQTDEACGAVSEAEPCQLRIRSAHRATETTLPSSQMAMMDDIVRSPIGGVANVS